MEVTGGAGYVEEGPFGRLFRESPLNSIWEGSGNVMCLDVLRAIARTPDDALRLLQDIGERHVGIRGEALREGFGEGVWREHRDEID